MKSQNYDLRPLCAFEKAEKCAKNVLWKTTDEEQHLWKRSDGDLNEAILRKPLSILVAKTYEIAKDSIADIVHHYDNMVSSIRNYIYDVENNQSIFVFGIKEDGIDDLRGINVWWNTKGQFETNPGATYKKVLAFLLRPTKTRTYDKIMFMQLTDITDNLTDMFEKTRSIRMDIDLKISYEPFLSDQLGNPICELNVIAEYSKENRYGSIVIEQLVDPPKGSKSKPYNIYLLDIKRRNILESFRKLSQKDVWPKIREIIHQYELTIGIDETLI